MKKIISEKIVALILILIAVGYTYYFNQHGKINFLPQKKEKQTKIIVAEIPINETQYRLSYKDKPDAAFDIANFENNENWFGDGDFDFSTYFEGEASLFLSSFNNQKATVWLKKSFDIKDVLNFKFLVHLATDPTYIEEFNLIFTGENKDYKQGLNSPREYKQSLNSPREYKFPIRDLKSGWNILVLPKESFSSFLSEEERRGEVVPETQIGKVTIELISRPKVRSIVHLDSLWAEGDKDYFKDWNLNSENFLALRKNGSTTSLLAINLTDSQATLRKGSGEDYTFQGKFTPLKKGAFGFFLRGDYKTGYGYYLVMNGAESNGWQIYKYGPFEEIVQTVNLAEGKISSNLGENLSYWLRADLKGHRMTFSFSQDGKNFVRLGEVNDKSFSSGGIGFTVKDSNMVFVDDLLFFQ